MKIKLNLAVLVEAEEYTGKSSKIVGDEIAYPGDFIIRKVLDGMPKIIHKKDDWSGGTHGENLNDVQSAKSLAGPTQTDMQNRTGDSCKGGRCSGD